MCGIAGYISFGKLRPIKEQIETMFSMLESRGTDASGYAYINNNELTVVKDAVKSSKLIQTKTWKELSPPKILIMHTRAKTQGTEANNMNNHPLFTKDGLCLVHNGMIFNDNEIFHKQKRDGEVDSEAILAVISKEEDPIKSVFDKLMGSFAVAVISTKEPNKLTLIKKDNPIELYFDAQRDVLYFCSERGMMQRAFNLSKRVKRGFNLGEYNFHYYEMANNHCLILNEEGVESYKEYTPRNNFSFYPTSYDTESYFWDDDFVECPYCLGQTRYFPDRLINRCRHCGQEISEEDIYM